ncbi:MAG: hypothetical protein NZ580_07800, partial [Bacteroidia bacterium]|nr:hypothetical protein [Bacteroidia bacterium]
MRTGVVAGILLVIVAGAAGFFYFKMQKAEKANVQLQEEKVELEREISELQQRITAMQQDLERKDMELSEKTRRVEELSKELDQARARIRKYEEQGRISARQAEEMRYKTEQMAYYIQKYQERIRELEEENQRLRTRTAELESQVQQRESEIRKAVEEKERLEVKVKAASYLKAVNLRFASVRDNGKEDWDTEFKARRLHRLKVCFTVLENAVAEPGERTAYIVIMDPNSKPLTNYAQGSGYFTLMDTEQPFSMKAVFSYQRSQQEVCATYERGEQELSKGTYRVE